MRSIILYALCTCISFAAVAQEIKVNESKAKFDKQYLNALETTVYYVSQRKVFKNFKRHLKEFEGKTTGKKGLIFGNDLSMPSISNNTVDVYAIAEALPDGNVALSVAFDLGSTYLKQESNPQAFETAKNMIRNFALKLSQEGYSNLLKKEEDKLNKIKKEHQSLIAKKDRLAQEIDTYKQKIIDNEQQIEVCTQDIANKQEEVNTAEEKFNLLKDGFDNIK